MLWIECEKNTGAASLSNFWTLQWDVGRQLNTCRSEAYLPASKLPFALSRHWGRFNICWAKPCTPVFLFLLSSRPEPPYVVVPTLLLSTALSYTSLLVLLPTSKRSSKKASLQQCCLALLFSKATNHTVGVLTVGMNQRSCLRLTLKDVGYPWLVIVAVSSGPKWVDASCTQTSHCLKLIYITLSQQFQDEYIKLYNSIITMDWMHRLLSSWDQIWRREIQRRGGLCEFHLSSKEEVSKSFGTLMCSSPSLTTAGEIVWSLRQMLQRLSGDMSGVKIPLAGLKTSCSQRKLLHETVWAKSAAFLFW